METISISREFLRTVPRDQRDQYAVVSWIGSDDISSASGSEIVKWYTEEKGHVPADFYEALKWQAEKHESGNSYDVLVVCDGNICKLSLSSLFPD